MEERKKKTGYKKINKKQNKRQKRSEISNKREIYK